MKSAVDKTLIYLILTIALGGISMLAYEKIRSTPPKPPVFSFDTQKADSWWGSDNTNIQLVAKTGNYTGEEPIDKLPVADLVVHHSKPGSTAAQDNCFIAHSYYDRPLENVDEAYKEYEDKKEKTGTIEAFSSSEQSFQTYEGVKQYRLQPYRLTVQGQDILEGYQVGFIPMSKGHVRIEGVCKTSQDLSLTLPILKSVQLLAD